MQLRALRSVKLGNGTPLIRPGAWFEAGPDVADSLIRRGLAEEPEPGPELELAPAPRVLETPADVEAAIVACVRAETRRRRTR